MSFRPVGLEGARKESPSSQWRLTHKFFNEDHSHPVRVTFCSRYDIFDEKKFKNMKVKYNFNSVIQIENAKPRIYPLVDIPKVMSRNLSQTIFSSRN